MSMDELIAKLEKATEGSRELDGLIAVATFERVCTADDLIYAVAIRLSDECARGTFWRVSRSGRSLHAAPFYTTSLDAALTLVPEGYVICSLKNGDMDVKYWDVRQFISWKALLAKVGLRVKDPQDVLKFPCGNGPTPALALCIAALKARATTGGKE